MLFFCYGSDLFMQVFLFFFYRLCTGCLTLYFVCAAPQTALTSCGFPLKVLFLTKWTFPPSGNLWTLTAPSEDKGKTRPMVCHRFAIQRYVVYKGSGFKWLILGLYLIFSMFSTGLHGSPAVLANSLDAVNAMAKKTPPWTIRLSRPTLPFYRTL